LEEGLIFKSLLELGKPAYTIGHSAHRRAPGSQQQEAFSAAFRGQVKATAKSWFHRLAAWIESNILLQLASEPFDKQDETLVSEAGSGLG
jgi:hypothetical protein